MVAFTSCEKSVKVRGVVTEKYILPATYAQPSGIYNLVMYSDSLKRKLHVLVSANDYVDIEINDTVCFMYKESELLDLRK